MKCDVDTFARMYEEIYKDLYRFALCMMKNAEDAEDAVSDAVLSGYENIRKLRDEKAFKSWMFTIHTWHLRHFTKIEQPFRTAGGKLGNICEIAGKAFF